MTSVIPYMLTVIGCRLMQWLPLLEGVGMHAHRYRDVTDVLERTTQTFAKFL